MSGIHVGITAAAVALVGIGFAGAAFGLVTATIDGIKNRDADRVTDAFPWGYMGVGLAVGALGFGLASFASPSPTGWSELRDAVPVLIVAAAGYAVLVQLLQRRFGQPLPWTTPLALSFALGVLIALAT